MERIEMGDDDFADVVAIAAAHGKSTTEVAREAVDKKIDEAEMPPASDELWDDAVEGE